MKLNIGAILDKISSPKVALFFSAYVPLFIIMGVKCFKYKILCKIPYIELNLEIPIFSIIIVGIIVCLIILFNIIIKKSKSKTEKFFTINKIEEKNDIILSYLIPYFFAVISFNSLEEIFSCIIIFIIIFFIYINSEILYINPLFLFKGYNFYKIYTKNSNILLISKRNVNREINERIGVKRIAERVYIQDDENE